METELNTGAAGVVMETELNTGAAGVVMETERQHKTDKQEAPFLATVFTVFGKFSH